MSVGFGFSIGDLFSGLRLIKDSIEAVNDTKGSSADYASLMNEIVSIEGYLEAIEEIRSNRSLPASQNAALDHAVTACQESIDDFISSISKYQPHLNVKASGFQAGYRKVKWALCKKDDVARFRAHLTRHASALNMLLTALQVRQTLGPKKAETVAMVKSQDGGENLVELLKGLSLDQRQMFIAMTHQNRQLMQTIEEMKVMMRMRTSIPPQVLLQEPVTLLDPFGKFAPFHLDFIDSIECFVAVLKARFSKAGVTAAGLSKLENQDFLLQDSRHRRPINLSKHWSSVFRPGQQVDMSMIFHRFACPPSTCPVCLGTNEEDEEDYTYCQSCGLCYRNVQAISKRNWDQRSLGHDIPINGEDIPYMLRQSGKQPEFKVFRPSTEPEDEIFEGYKRVQLVSQPLELLDSKYPGLQLISDFIDFARLLKGAPADASAYLSTIRVLHGRAVQHKLVQCKSFPAFASFSQIEQVRNQLAQESIDLRRDIDALVQNLYNDPDTKELMRYIREKYPSNHARDYYTGVLARMGNEPNFNKAQNARARSAEPMQWLLLDGRSR